MPFTSPLWMYSNKYLHLRYMQCYRHFSLTPPVLAASGFVYSTSSCKHNRANVQALRYTNLCGSKYIYTSHSGSEINSIFKRPISKQAAGFHKVVHLLLIIQFITVSCVWGWWSDTVDNGSIGVKYQQAPDTSNQHRNVTVVIWPLHMKVLHTC